MQQSLKEKAGMPMLSIENKTLLTKTNTISKTLSLLCWSRLSDVIVALKEIRLEHEEGAPCTAIREGKCTIFFHHPEIAHSALSLFHGNINYSLFV